MIFMLLIGVLADDIGGLSFSGQNIVLSLNVYVFAILFIACLVWKMIAGRGGRGGRY